MKSAWPWLTLGSYGLLSALLATTGRAAFGPAQALSPRYAIFGVSLTVALVYLLPVVLLNWASPEISSRSRRATIRATLAALGAAVVGLHALAWPAAVVNLTLFSLDLRHAKACLKFLDTLPPQPATLAYLCPSYAKVKTMADALDRAGVLGYPLLRTHQLADFTQTSQPTGEYGSIENCQTLGTNLFLAGWARAADRPAPADCVVFTCAGEGVAPEIFALMDQRLVRTDLVSKNHDATFLIAGWQETCPLADLPKGALTVRAWSYDTETDRLTPLANEVHLNRR